jgi:predicted nucleic acid-binding protein
MRVVVADTSPINYLILIDCIDLLRSLYSSIVIPDEVFNELTAVGAPPQVAAWIRSQPDWVEIRSAPFGVPLQLAANESDLDAGEPAAIQLALSEHDSLLLIDEAAGRSVASRLGLANTGTLGVVLAGARDGLTNLKATLYRLQRTNFRISQSLIDKLLADAHDGKGTF